MWTCELYIFKGERDSCRGTNVRDVTHNLPHVRHNAARVVRHDTVQSQPQTSRMVRDVQQRHNGRLSVVRESLGDSVDTENESHVVPRGNGARPAASERLARVSRGSELHDGIRDSGTASERRADAAFADGVSAILADDLADGERTYRESLRAREGANFDFPLYGELTGSNQLLYERIGDIDDGIWGTQGIRESEAERTRTPERPGRDQIRAPRSIKHVRWATRKALWHFRRTRDLLETVQWHLDTESGEESEN